MDATVFIQSANQNIPIASVVLTLMRGLQDILQHQPVQLAYLYGSTVTGQTHPWSDIDVGVVFDPTASLNDYQKFRLTLQIESVLQEEYKLPTAEVRRIDDAPLRVQGKIITEGTLLYVKDNRFRIDYEGSTRQRYFDFQPVINQFCQHYFSKAIAADFRSDVEKTMYDLQKVQGVLTNLDEYVGQLHQLAQKPRAEFLADKISMNAAKYCLLTAVECCIDLNNHLIASMGFRAPESYADTFAVLAEQGVFDNAFLATARQMVSMRNRLVHLYWDVDNNILYDVLQNNLTDFDRYKADIVGFVFKK